MARAAPGARALHAPAGAPPERLAARRSAWRTTTAEVALPPAAAFEAFDPASGFEHPSAEGGVLAPGCGAVADPATGPTIRATGPAAHAPLRRCLRAVAEVFPHWGATVEVPPRTPAWEAAWLWLAVDAGPLEGPTALRVATSRGSAR
jgi:hypothetical protein